MNSITPTWLNDKPQIKVSTLKLDKYWYFESDILKLLKSDTNTIDSMTKDIQRIIDKKNWRGREKDKPFDSRDFKYLIEKYGYNLNWEAMNIILSKNTDQKMVEVTKQIKNYPKKRFDAIYQHIHDPYRFERGMGWDVEKIKKQKQIDKENLYAY